jgi:hypothetical protein
MTEKSIDLDKHRGMAAQKATDPASLAAQDPRRQKLIAAVIDDFERLAREA